MEVKRIISLGAGVQSSTMLLMALAGEFDETPDCAIFADTGWEPKAVYDHLDYLQGIADAHGFAIHRVQKGNIRAAAMEARHAGGVRFAPLPLHIRNLDGSPAMLRRQCTREFKVEPLTKKQRELCGLVPRQRAPKGAILCETWIGISTDEAQRMRDSRETWAVNRYPLIEKRMSRRDCLAWLESRGYRRPPKSACIGCPYHHDSYWRELKRESPAEFADAVEFDAAMRTQHRLTGTTFVHKSLKPLDEVDFSSAEDRGQQNLFNNECEGMCGV